MQIYFKNLNKLADFTNFLSFFQFYFYFLPPGSGSSRQNECGSMRIWIHSPAFSQNLFLFENCSKLKNEGVSPVEFPNYCTEEEIQITSTVDQCVYNNLTVGSAGWGMVGMHSDQPFKRGYHSVKAVYSRVG